MFQPKDEEVLQAFQAAHLAWHDSEALPASRAFRVHAHLLNILDLLSLSTNQNQQHEVEENLWWKLELEVRRDLARPINLKQLEAWSGVSAATIARAAQAAVGESPMRRIKQIRLSFARGLVQRSELSFSQIAERIGYTRVHEFSRDYKAEFGLAPSNDPDRIARR